MIEVVLADAELAFKPLSPVKFNIDRLETNPRFAAISRPANAAILVRLRIDMEDRGGNDRAAAALRDDRADPRRAAADVHGREVRPRPDLGRPSRDRDRRRRKSRSRRCSTRRSCRCSELMQLEVGDTLTLEIKPDAHVAVRCGDVSLTEGRMGRVGDRVAVRVGKPLRTSANDARHVRRHGHGDATGGRPRERYELRIDDRDPGRGAADADHRLLLLAQPPA